MRYALQHIKGFQRIRYFGFLVNSQRKEKLAACRALLGLGNPELPYIPDIDEFLSNSFEKDST